MRAQHINQKLAGQETPARLQFVSYATQRGGVYIFMPDGAARAESAGEWPPMVVVRGPLLSEAHVLYSAPTGGAGVGALVRTQVLRLRATASEGDAVELENLVDLRPTSNVEIGLRLDSAVQSGAIFHTDLNCFTVPI